MKNVKRILSLILVLTMCFSLLPFSAFAEEAGAEDEITVEEPQDLSETPEMPETPEEGGETAAE